MYPELKGRKAIVTGATAGIGKSIALQLAQEGVDVAAIGRNKERGLTAENELRKLSPESFFISCDVANPDDAQAAYDETVKQFGRVDILVNCAGGTTKIAKVSEYSVDEWDDLQNSNLRSAFLFIRLTIPEMVSRNWGRIINISSVAFWSPYPTSALYASAKAGMVGLTRHVALEVAQFGVTVNATAPGMTLTERAQAGKALHSKLFEERTKLIPVGRFATPDEQGGIVVFLCSDKGAYITGATINLSGGVVMS
jgi:3-oxoacyl-[acyl-carrier protein] reductase